MKKIAFVLIALAVSILFISCPQANSDNQSPPPPEFTLTLDPTDGSVNPSSLQVTQGSPIGPLPTPTKAGFTFTAWQIDGKTITKDTVWNYTEDKTAIALWVETYTITFDDGSGNTYTQDFVEGSPQNLKSLNFTMPSGKGFSGWTTTQGSPSVEYANEESYTATKDDTLYPVWVDNILYVTATLNDTGTEITIKEATDGTTNQLMTALNTLGSTKNLFTKITIVAPANGARITPETDLSLLFGANTIESSYHYTRLATIEGLEHIDTSNVTDISSMFQNCISLTSLDGLNNWDVSNVVSIDRMFYRCAALKDISALKNWNTALVTDMSEMFRGCGALTNIDALKNWNTALVTDMEFMFYQCSALANLDALSNWNTTQVTDMQYMFSECSALANIEGLKNWNTTQVTVMDLTFARCRTLENIDALKNWNTANVTYMRQMFNGCSSLTSINALNWNTANVTSMYAMFTDCSALANIEGLSNWNTALVTSMRQMFDGCTNLTTLDISGDGWNDSLVTNADDMFLDCNALTQAGVDVGPNITGLVKAQIDAL